MDPINHLCQKLAAEQTFQSLRPQQQQQQQQAETTGPPPPYTDSTSDSDDDDNDDEDEEVSQPVKLTLDATHRIQGSNNLVPTSASPLADATRFSTLLLAAVAQLNRASAPSSTSLGSKMMKVDLTINCGITVIGDRNVVGNVGLKAKVPLPVGGGGGGAGGEGVGAGQRQEGNVVAGAKRKSEEEDVDAGGEGGPLVKRVAGERE